MASTDDWTMIRNVLSAVVSRVDAIMVARGMPWPPPDNPMTADQLRAYAEEMYPMRVVSALPPEDEPTSEEWKAMMGRLQVIEQPRVFPLCVMCHAEDPKVTRMASFVACGHTVCDEHVDEVLEAGA